MALKIVGGTTLEGRVPDGEYTVQPIERYIRSVMHESDRAELRYRITEGEFVGRELTLIYHLDDECDQKRINADVAAARGNRESMFAPSINDITFGNLRVEVRGGRINRVLESLYERPEIDPWGLYAGDTK